MDVEQIIETVIILKSHRFPKQLMHIIINYVDEKCKVCYKTLCYCTDFMCDKCYLMGWRKCATSTCDNVLKTNYFNHCSLCEKTMQTNKLILCYS